MATCWRIAKLLARNASQGLSLLKNDETGPGNQVVVLWEHVPEVNVYVHVRRHHREQKGHYFRREGFGGSVGDWIDQGVE